MGAIFTLDEDEKRKIDAEFETRYEAYVSEVRRRERMLQEAFEQGVRSRLAAIRGSKKRP